MVATAATTYTATTDGESFYVQDGNGEFHRDHRDMIACYDTRDDAVEVAAALTEGRAIRPRGYTAPVTLPAAPPFPEIEFYNRVRYHGSLTDHYGAILSAEECACIPPHGQDCDGFYLSGAVGGRSVVIRHARRTSFTVLADED